MHYKFEGEGAYYPLQTVDHDERGIILYPKSLDDLFVLFSEPALFFREAYAAFEYPEPPVWEPGDDITFIIQPVDAGVTSYEASASFHAANKDHRFPSYGDWSAAMTAVLTANIRTLDTNSKNKFENELVSNYTVQAIHGNSVIKVLYFSPFVAMQKRSTARYQGPVSYVTVSDTNFMRHTHFDLETNYPTETDYAIDRAKIAIDFMSDSSYATEFVRRAVKRMQFSTGRISSGTTMTRPKEDDQCDQARVPIEYLSEDPGIIVLSDVLAKPEGKSCPSIKGCPACVDIGSVPRKDGKHKVTSVTIMKWKSTNRLVDKCGCGCKCTCKCCGCQ